MKIITEVGAKDFSYWSGAEDTIKRVEEHSEKDRIYEIIEEAAEIFGGEEGWTDTQLNDFVWFDLVDYLWDSYEIDLTGDHKEEEEEVTYQVYANGDPAGEEYDNLDDAKDFAESLFGKGEDGEIYIENSEGEIVAEFS